MRKVCSHIDYKYNAVQINRSLGRYKCIAAWHNVPLPVMYDYVLPTAVLIVSKLYLNSSKQLLVTQIFLETTRWKIYTFKAGFLGAGRDWVIHQPK